MGNKLIKPSYLSKTNWTNLIIAGAAFFPSVSGFIAENPQIFVLVFALVNVALRFLSKKEIKLL